MKMSVSDYLTGIKSLLGGDPAEDDTPDETIAKCLFVFCHSVTTLSFKGAVVCSVTGEEQGKANNGGGSSIEVNGKATKG